MKKSLSLLVAIAMVFSVFASMASAAELTAQQKFDALKEAGIFEGYPDGTAGLNKEMTRAEFSKVLALVNGLTQEATAANYTDVAKGHWAAGFIGAVTKAGLMEGVGLNKFNPNGKVTVEQMAKTVVLSAGLEESSVAVQGTVSDWAKGYVAAAVEAGIIPAQSNYKSNATRELLVEAAYVVSGGEVKAPVGELSIAKAAQSGASAISVEFNRALTDAEKNELVFTVKNDATTVETTKTFSEDNKTVKLTASYLSTGTYTVEVTGFAAQTVNVTEAVPAKIEFGTASLMIGAQRDLGVKVFNQFGEEITNPSLEINAYNGSKGRTLNVSGTSVDMTVGEPNNPNVQKGDAIVVSAIVTGTGVSASKTYTAVDASAIVSLKLGTVQPLEGNTRITAGDTGLVLPYEFVDAQGNKYTLPSEKSSAENNEPTRRVVFDPFIFTVYGDAYINGQPTPVIDASTFSVDNEGKLTFNANAAGTATINVMNPSAGASTSITVVVADTTKVAKFQLSNPGKLIAAGETVTIPFTATDNYGNAIAQSQFAKAEYKNQLKVNLNGQQVTPTFNSKGEMSLTFPTAGAAYVHVTVNQTPMTSTLNLTVREAAVPKQVSAVNDLALYYGVNGSDTVDIDSVKVIDNYGRTMTKLTGYSIVATPKDASVVSVTYDGKVIGQPINDNAGVKSTTLTIGLKKNGETEYVKGSTINPTVYVVADNRVTSFEIKDLNSVNSVHVPANGMSEARKALYKESIELVGKTTDGKTVAIDQARFYTAVTSSNLGVVAVEGKQLVGKANGEVTITAYNGATKIAEKTVKASDAAPQAAKVEFDKTEVALSLANPTISTIIDDLKVVDQYGVDITNYANGTWASSDRNVLQLNADGTVVKAGQGSATISYITANGVIGTVGVTVN
ncbi:S-layer-like y domain-containing protein [Paenibacillus tarimensis]